MAGEVGHRANPQANPGGNTNKNIAFGQGDNGKQAKIAGVTDSDFQRVGGDLTFLIGSAVMGKDGRYTMDELKATRIELAPARASMHEKQGQRVPGVGAGLEIRAKANIAKLNVPGARPIYQHMGIAEETIEWVGAFVGYDNPLLINNLSATEDDRLRIHNAWEESFGIRNEMMKGHELMIALRFSANTPLPRPDAAGATDKTYVHALKFYGEVQFRGYIKELRRVYATAQRVYYAVTFVVTNHEDMLLDRRNENAPIALPKDIKGGINVPSAAQIAAFGSQNAATATGQAPLTDDQLRDSGPVPQKLSNELRAKLGTDTEATVSATVDLARRDLGNTEVDIKVTDNYQTITAKTHVGLTDIQKAKSQLVKAGIKTPEAQRALDILNRREAELKQMSSGGANVNPETSAKNIRDEAWSTRMSEQNGGRGGRTGGY